MRSFIFADFPALRRTGASARGVHLAAYTFRTAIPKPQTVFVNPTFVLPQFSYEKTRNLSAEKNFIKILPHKIYKLLQDTRYSEL